MSHDASGAHPAGGRLGTDPQDTGEILVVTLWYAGTVWRWSSSPGAWEGVDGDLVVADGGLGAVDVRDTLALLSDAPDLRSVSLALPWPPERPAAQLVSRGHDLSTAVAEVAVAVVGEPWASRHVALRGTVVQPSYGATGEPVRLTVAEVAADDAAMWPSSEMIVSYDTFAAPKVDHIGRYYPLPSGRPGNADLGNWPGSPAVGVGTSAGHTTFLMIAGCQVLASTVNIWGFSGGSLDAFVSALPVSHTQDLLGRTYARVDITLETTIYDSEEWYVSWPDGEYAMRSVLRDGPARSAGDALAYWLSKSSLVIDWQRTAQACAQLHGTILDWFAQDGVVPWEWIRTNLLPIVPVSMANGPNGSYPVVYRWEATAYDAVADLVAEPGNVVRVSQVEYDRSYYDFYDQVVLECRHDPAYDAIRLTVTARATPTHDLTDNTDYAGSMSSIALETGWSRIAATPRAPRVNRVSSDIIWDRATAYAVATWLAARDARAHRLVSYDVTTRRYAWLRAGDIVTITDDAVSLAGEVAVITEVMRTTLGRLEIKLLLLDLPQQVAALDVAEPQDYTEPTLPGQ